MKAKVCTRRIAGQIDLPLSAVWGPPRHRETAPASRGEEPAEGPQAAPRRRSAVGESPADARLLGKSEKIVTDRLEEGRMVGLRINSRLAIPRWQFDTDSRDGLLPGVEMLNARFPGARSR